MSGAAATGGRSVGLRIPPGRVRLWGIGLFLIGLAPIVAAPFYGFHDWPAFWSAGTVVGTSDLVDGARLIAWQTAHGLAIGVFPYLPAAALVLWPFAHLPLDVSFWLHAALMLASALLAARIAARVFGLPLWLAVVSTLGWAPLTAAIVIGQNTPLALLLAMVAIEGLVLSEPARSAGGEQARRPPGSLRAGLGTAFLLYKPTLALPLIGLFVLRRRWIALAVVAASLPLWYLGGVIAAGGDLGWPAVWVNTIRSYLADDAAHNIDKAISLPGVMARLPVSSTVALLAGLVLVVLAIPRLIRAPIREAAAGACLVGLAASPHAWGYDAALMLPAVWWALGGGLTEPWRTRLIVAAYLLVPFWLISAQTQISTVAIVVIGGAVVWLSGRWRGDYSFVSAPSSAASAATAPAPAGPGTATPLAPSERGSLPLGQ